MKRKLLITSFIICLFILLSSCTSTKPSNDSYPYLTEVATGFVPNEEVAIDLAKIYFLAIYGESVQKYKKYEAKLVDGIWYVNGILEGEMIAGGCPYIKINKQDGRVLGIIHTK